MAIYQHILVGLDLSEDARKVLTKAKQLADACEAKLSLAHIIEPLTFSYGGDLPLNMANIQQDIQAHAEKELKQLGESFTQPCETHVLIGQPSHELHRLAADTQADVIVVGSHGRHGLALLLGSTSNAVLHGCDCDVLAVRI